MKTKNDRMLSAKQNKKRLDEATAEIIQGINYLLLKAQAERLVTITNILENARESITWWAVNDDYNEPGAEKLAHQLTLNNGMYTALSLLAKFSAISDTEIRQELLSEIKQFQLKVPLPLNQ